MINLLLFAKLREHYRTLPNICPLDSSGMAENWAENIR